MGLFSIAESAVGGSGARARFSPAQRPGGAQTRRLPRMAWDIWWSATWSRLRRWATAVSEVVRRRGRRPREARNALIWPASAPA